MRLLQSPTCCSKLASDSEGSILSQEFLSCNPEGAEEFVFSPNGPITKETRVIARHPDTGGTAQARVNIAPSAPNTCRL